MLGRRGGEHVDGIADARGRRKKRAQRVAPWSSRERRQLESLRLAGVGGEDAGAAGVGHDRRRAGRAGTGWCASSAATSNSSSSVSVRMTPACRNSASTTTSLAASAPVCDDAARAPAARASGLDGDDRLAPRDAARDARELARISEALEVEQDDVGPRIVGPVLQ